MWFPPPPHESPRQLSHVLENILEDNSVARGSQLTEATQLLAPFVVQHAQNAFDGQHGEIII
jgi:hypothetical protein